MPPSCGGEGQRPNGVFGSWMSGKSLKGERLQPGQAGFLLPGVFSPFSKAGNTPPTKV